MKELSLIPKIPIRAWLWRNGDHCADMEFPRITPQVTEIGNTTYWLNGDQYLWDGAVIVEVEKGVYRVLPYERVEREYHIKGAKTCAKYLHKGR